MSALPAGEAQRYLRVYTISNSMDSTSSVLLSISVRRDPGIDEHNNQASSL